jgi:antitoxin component HigA of HigAB toxin-antitoxin module
MKRNITRNRRTYASGDSYLALVQQHPLRRIKSESQHAAALSFLTATSLAHQSTRDRGVIDYLETLAKLIEDYEKQAGHGLDLSGLSAVTAIEHLMQVHGLTVTAMARIVGTTQGTLSDILRGKRAVSKGMIRHLVDRFGVDARVFL